MMEEFRSDDTSDSMRPRKRPCSVLRDFEVSNVGYLSEHSSKKMRGTDNGPIQYLKVLKVGHDGKWHPSANSCKPSTRPSAVLLKLLPSSSSSDDDDDDEIVRDGGDNKLKGENTKHQSKNMSITYQSEADRLKSFIGWPLNEAVHPEQLARVGFVYTGDGALVQCFQCGVKYRHWYKGDVPLNVHRKCNPRCPFLQTLSSNSKSSPPERRLTRSYIQPESRPVINNTQGEEVNESKSSTPEEMAHFYYNDQNARMKLESFNCSAEGRDWEWRGNDNDEHCRDGPDYSYMTATKLDIPKPEVTPTRHQSNIQSDGSDDCNKCFKSPTHSQNGSLNASQSSECLTLEGSQQEAGSNNFVRYPYRPEETRQRITPRNVLVPGMDGAIVLVQDPPSLSVSTNYQLDISVHSLDTDPRSNYTRTNSGDVIETAVSATCCPPSLRQSQALSKSFLKLPPSTKLRGSSKPPDDGKEDTITGMQYPPSWEQHQSTSPQGASEDSESFYSAGSHPAPKTKNMYEESLSEGLENQLAS